MTQTHQLEWVTPELIEYGDVSKLTEVPVKTVGSGDELAATQLTIWGSGTYNPP